MLAILFVISITIGPLIAAASALMSAEKGNYARATVYHIVYMAGSLIWCLLPPLGLNLGILIAPGTGNPAFKIWAVVSAAAATILIIELCCYRRKFHDFFAFSFSYIAFIVLQFGMFSFFTLNENPSLTQP